VQTASGAVACQLMDALHPGIVPMGRVSLCCSRATHLSTIINLSWVPSQVDFNARNEYEYVNNYKLLQAAFTKANVQKVPDILSAAAATAGHAARQH
jgi:microtubule-associated protein, RP/EB family